MYDSTENAGRHDLEDVNDSEPVRSSETAENTEYWIQDLHLKLKEGRNFEQQKNLYHDIWKLWIWVQGTSYPISKGFSLLRRSRNIWAATWQNQQSDCAPSEDSDQPGLGIRPVWSESSLCT